MGKKSATTLIAKMAEDHLKKNEKEQQRNKKKSATTLVAKMTEDKIF